MNLKNNIKAIIFYAITIIVCNKAIGQELVLKTNFTVRDFQIVDSTLVYIEKRDIKSYNLISRTNDTLFKNGSFFIGGYGLRIFYSKKQKTIITASNELVKNRSSIRFYNTEKKDINKFHVLYDTELMDFFIQPNDSLFFLSKKDSTIIGYKYGNKPRYKKTDSIKTDSYARNIKLLNSTLIYLTDSGKVFQYNLKTKKNKLLYEGENLLVSFIFDKNYKNIYATTFDGKIIKISLSNPLESQEYNFGNHIIEAINIYMDKYLIVGDWSGQIGIIDINTNEVVKKHNDKKRIVKIIVKGDYFYTSSSNRTIKKWKIDK